MSTNIEYLRSFKLNIPGLPKMALFDLITSFVFIILIVEASRRKHFKSLNPLTFLIASLAITIPLSIFVHIVFGVKTALNTSLGLAPT